ncbi:MAG: hypothetical protein P8Y03_25745 [Anaerolineales bacterium]
MQRIDPNAVRSTRSSLKKKKVFDFPMLLFLLNCSVRTGRSMLRKWRAHTSYNKNGQYYALPDVPRFDENGLWWHKGAYFSKYGTLKNTVVHLVGASSAGLSGEQIGELVGLDPRSFLHHFRDTPGMQRRKHQGVYVYFSDGVARFEEQLRARLEAIASDADLSDADAVVILVVLIKHYGIEPESIALLPEVKAKGISAAAIQRFVERHDLKKRRV